MTTPETPLQSLLRLFSPTINFPASGDIGSFNYHPNTQWQTSLYRGNALAEQTIYQQVAGPGSQLGTLLDAVLLLAAALERSNPELGQAGELLKLRDLGEQVSSTLADVRTHQREFLQRHLDAMAAQDKDGLLELLRRYVPEPDAGAAG